MTELWEITKEVISGLVVLLIGGAVALLIRRLSARWRRLWQRMSEGRYVPLTFFLAGISCTFLGIVLTYQPLITGGFFLIGASGLYALFFRRSRQREPERRTELERTTTKPSQLRNRSSEATAQPAMPATNTTSSPKYVVGDTVTPGSGDRLTVHSFESPIPPPSYKETKTGYEFLVIDVEACANPNSGGQLDYINPFDFALQMPDNTRLEPEEQHAERELGHTPLSPGDCVRGRVFFQVPIGEEPRSVIFTRSTFGEGSLVIKWSI